MNPKGHEEPMFWLWQKPTARHNSTFIQPRAAKTFWRSCQTNASSESTQSCFPKVKTPVTTLLTALESQLVCTFLQKTLGLRGPDRSSCTFMEGRKVKNARISPGFPCLLSSF